jgi:hypothetical protein
MFESLISEVCLIPDQKYHHCSAEDALQVVINEFHGASISSVDQMVVD